MKELHINTPLVESLSMSRQSAGKVWLKMETMQPCGSFKARGIGYACQKYVTVFWMITEQWSNPLVVQAYQQFMLGVNSLKIKKIF